MLVPSTEEMEKTGVRADLPKPRTCEGQGMGEGEGQTDVRHELEEEGQLVWRDDTRAHGSVRGQRVLWRVMLGAKLRREASASGVNNDANKFCRIETLRRRERCPRRRTNSEF